MKVKKMELFESKPMLYHRLKISILMCLEMIGTLAYVWWCAGWRVSDKCFTSPWLPKVRSPALGTAIDITFMLTPIISVCEFFICMVMLFSLMRPTKYMLHTYLLINTSCLIYFAAWHLFCAKTLEKQDILAIMFSMAFRQICINAITGLIFLLHSPNILVVKRKTGAPVEIKKRKKRVRMDVVGLWDLADLIRAVKSARLTFKKECEIAPLDVKLSTLQGFDRDFTTVEIFEDDADDSICEDCRVEIGRKVDASNENSLPRKYKDDDLPPKYDDGYLPTYDDYLPPKYGVDLPPHYGTDKPSKDDECPSSSGSDTDDSDEEGFFAEISDDEPINP